MSAIQHSLKKQLEVSGFSAGMLARKAGVPVSSIKNILQGKVENPRFDTINALAEALGVPAKSLMLSDHHIPETPRAPFNMDDFIEMLSMLTPLLKQTTVQLTKKDTYLLMDEIYEYMSFAKQQAGGILSKEALTSFINWSLWQRKS